MRNKCRLPDAAAVYGGLVFLFLLGMAAFAFRIDFSVQEKRYLASLPENPSLVQWTLNEDLEAYLSDHVPLRTQLIHADATVQVLTGRRTQLGAWPVGESIVEQPVQAEPETLQRRIDALQGIAGEIPTLFLTPPTAGMLEMDRMPPYLRAVYAQEAELYDGLVSRKGFVPLKKAFLDSAKPVYFRTDHHWNGEGAYLAYRSLCDAMGLKAYEREDFCVSEFFPFSGTTCSRSGLPFVRPDTLVCYEPGLPLSMTADGEHFDRVIFPEEAGSWDGYQVFLKGNHGFLTIENPQGTGTLLIFKDSFANSVIPMLSAHFSRICAVDARYFSGSFRQALEETGNIDQILFLYSLDSLANDTSILKKLRDR